MGQKLRQRAVAQLAVLAPRLGRPDVAQPPVAARLALLRRDEHLLARTAALVLPEVAAPAEQLPV